MNDVSPANRSARPSAFAKLYYFMRPDRGRMAVSLLLACVGEAVGMVPYLVIALLAAGLVDEIMIAIAPVTIGQGAPLFKPHAEKRHYALIAARPLKNGTMILHYGVKSAA